MTVRVPMEAPPRRGKRPPELRFYLGSCRFSFWFPVSVTICLAPAGTCCLAIGRSFVSDRSFTLGPGLTAQLLV